MNIDILYDSRNYTIIRDNLTKWVWLYSYQQPIAFLDDNKKIHFSGISNWTQTNKMHFASWKKFLNIEK